MSSLRERRVAATLNIKPYKRLSSHFTNDTEISDELSHSRKPSLSSQASGELSESEGLPIIQSVHASKHIPKKPPKYIFNENKVLLFH